MNLEMLIEPLLDPLTNRLKNRIRRLMGVNLVGRCSVMLTFSECQSWNEVCNASGEFKALEAKDLNVRIAEARFAADASEANESALRAAITEKDRASDAMGEFACKWYDALCADTPEIVRK